jgi:acyl-CoA dehydrogenase
MPSFALEEEQRLIVETVRGFAKDKMRPAMRKAERAGGPDDELVRGYGALGVAALEMPAEVGGSELGATTAALVSEELAWGDPGLAVALRGPGSLDIAALCLGSPAQQVSLLTPFVEDPKARGAVAFADARPAEAPGLATRAERSGQGWKLSGEKGLVAGATASRFVVFAQSEPERGWDGVGAFVVERENPNVEVGERQRTLGLNAVAFASLSLSGCYVSDDARLAMPGGLREGVRLFFARLMTRSAARLVGLSRAAYEHALDYAKERQAFGKPVAHFQAVAFMLSEMLMDIESMRWMTWRAASRLDAKARAYAESAAAFAHAAEYGQRVAERAVQLLGGAGYVQDHPVEKWMRDAKTLSLFGGSPESARVALAEELLDRGDSAPLGDLLPTPDIQPVLV